MFSCPSNLNIGEVLVRLCSGNIRGPLFYLQENDGRETLAWGKSDSGSLAWAKEQSGPTFGGTSFWGEWRSRTTNFWEDFSPEFFFAPEFLLRKRGGSVSLSIFSHGSRTEIALAKEWAELLAESMPDIAEPVVELSASSAGKKEWTDLCGSASVALQAGELQKLVLARYKSGEIYSGLSANFLVQELLKLPGAGVHKYVFRENEDVFMGASPEYLFQISNGEILVPAVAGTRPRGKSPEADEALAKELYDSPKERKEHDLVVQFIREKIQSFGFNTVVTAEPELRKLARLQHLYTPLSAKVSGDVKPLQYLQALHPTPAMGGLPRENALSLLKKLENWERGYFASPIGFSIPEENTAAFVVGIRGLLVRLMEVYAFAGAGYMPESDPQAEWQETEEKMQTMLQLFRGSP